MLYPIATHVHSRFHRRNRRIIAGVMLTAATIVAVVLFLATAVPAHADTPSDEADGCSGLAAVTLTVSGTNSASGSSAAPSALCDLTISVRRPADSSAPVGGAGGASGDSTAAAPCRVTATPTPLPPRGTRVVVAMSGDCDGVEFRSRVSIGPESPPGPSDDAAPPAPDASSVSGAVLVPARYTTAYSKIIGHDLGRIFDMFWNKSKVAWRYTTSRIITATHYPSEDTLSHRPFGDGWTVVTESDSLTRLSSTLYEASHYVEFHVHIPILADPRAYTTAYLYPQAGGRFLCDHSGRWKNPDLGFGWVLECNRGG